MTIDVSLRAYGFKPPEWRVATRRQEANNASGCKSFLLIGGTTASSRVRTTINPEPAAPQRHGTRLAPLAPAVINAPFFPLSIAPAGQGLSADAADQASAPPAEVDGSRLNSFFSILFFLALPNGNGSSVRSEASSKPARSDAAPVEKDSGLGLIPADSVSAIPVEGILNPLPNGPATDLDGPGSGEPLEESLSPAPAVETRTGALQKETQLAPRDPATEVLSLSVVPPGNPAADPSAGPADKVHAENPAVREIFGRDTGRSENRDGAANPEQTILGPTFAAPVIQPGDPAGAVSTPQDKVASPVAQPPASPPQQAQEGKAFALAQGDGAISKDSVEARKNPGTMALAAPFEPPDGIRRNPEGRGQNLRYSQVLGQVKAEPARSAQGPGFSFEIASRDDSGTVARPTGAGPETVLAENSQTVFRPNETEGSSESSAGAARNFMIPEQIHETAIHSNVEKAGAHPLHGASLIGPEAPVFNNPPPSSPQTPAPSWRSIVERVSGEIAAHVRQNTHEAVIQLEPPELGKLKISLLVKGDTVQARLISETDEARGMLQTHLPELREALHLHKLDLLHVSVDVSGWSGAGEEWNGRWPSESARQERDPSLAAQKASHERNKPAEGSGISVWA
jgi:flagellar hook-length control protein FliK